MVSREVYDRFLAEVRKETGIEAMSADEAGLVTVRVEEKYNLNLQFVEASGRILCFVEIAVLPKDAPKEVYRDLLAGGLFGKDTAGGFFTLEEETESVVYNYFFDLETAAKDVFEVVRGGRRRGRDGGAGRVFPGTPGPGVTFRGGCV